MVEIDRDLIERGLQRTASTKERVDALHASGLPTLVIAQCMGVTDQSVRKYRDGDFEPRKGAFTRLDFLRAVMGQLITKKGLEPGQAASWLRSVPDTPPYIPPIDLIADQPEKVIEMAANEPYNNLRPVE